VIILQVKPASKKIIDIEDAIPDSERNQKVVEKLDKLRYKSYTTYTALYKSPSHTARRDYIIFLSVSQFFSSVHPSTIFFN
jgi:hypothetical protein